MTEGNEVPTNEKKNCTGTIAGTINLACDCCEKCYKTFEFVIENVADKDAIISAFVQNKTDLLAMGYQIVGWNAVQIEAVGIDTWVQSISVVYDCANPPANVPCNDRQI